MKHEWFKDWFNSPYYHILYKDRDDKEAKKFLKNLSTLLQLQPGDRVLDLACGKGRHSIYLSKKGCRVTGLDLSPENIEQAKSFETPDLTFAVHDMRETYPGGKFDFVLNLFTSFGYFENTEDNRRVLKSVHQMLVPGGIFVIDFLNAENVIRDLVAEEEKTVEGITFQIRRAVAGKMIIKDIWFNDMGRDYHFTEKVQALTLKDFRELLAESGFEIIYTFGDYNLNPFRSAQSPRLILAGRKSNV